MPNYYDKATMFAWMPLTGFDKDLPDKGVSTLLHRTKFDLHGVCLFVFHPDIVHHHNGMEEVRILPPDNCSYYANPYNEERNRQEWTNHDLRDLATELRSHGTECFISIMGVMLENRFHEEWLVDHPELRVQSKTGPATLLAIKRFADGTYYEDYFADKLCQVMEDYGFSGVHISDAFCPQFPVVHKGDFSLDLLEQFSCYQDISLPEDLIADPADTPENVTRRGDWIWEHYRAEWIEFLNWRWNCFWKKICDRMHAIGKKVFVLGMYCTDPFDTAYLCGVDLQGIVRAGVDYLMPNMAANGSSIARNRFWPYYQWANMMPLSDAYAPDAKKLNMLGVKDAAEEWDMLHHAPTLLDRDISFLPSYLRYQKDGTLKRCIDGYNVCLADGIYEDEWKWLRERFDIGFSALPVKTLAPTMVWSDTVHHNMLREYIKTRRWTPHKFLYELNWAGAQMGAIVRSEDLSDACGDLFVPNFDLLSNEEQEQIASYRGGTVICTAAAEFLPEACGITPQLQFTDEASPFRNTVFAFGGKAIDPEEILSLAAEPDDTPGMEDPFHAPESPYSLTHDMPYQKVSAGFVKALAALIKSTYSDRFTSTHPVIPMQMADGAIRIYVLNDDRLHYANAIITTKSPILRVKNVSKFPLLPVKFSSGDTFHFDSPTEPGDYRNFRVLVPQGGLAIVDLYLDN